MPVSHNFEHLPLILRYQGRAKLSGGGKTSPQTIANRTNRVAHSTGLRAAGSSVSSSWKTRIATNQRNGSPVLPEGMPVLLEVDPGLDLDFLREKFAFEIVAEQEEGFVIVASEDLDLTAFLQMVDDFGAAGKAKHGSGRIASIHRLIDDPNQEERLRRILSESLVALWPNLQDDQLYVVDAGIACSGTQEIPAVPNRRKRDSDAEWARRETEWAEARSNAYAAWDDLKVEREEEIGRIINHYAGEVLENIDGAPFDSATLPDSFTLRIRMVGRGLRDFLLAYPYIFEVVEPENVDLPQRATASTPAGEPAFVLAPPDEDAPAVCIIDSGIQEGHVLLGSAVATEESHSFLPGADPADIADRVRPGGHGTRVAGAVLYGDQIPTEGTAPAPCWIQNAKVLNDACQMPVELFPPAALRAAVERFNDGVRKTRIFNHSINSTGYCRTRYMSAWAAEIDSISAQRDVLVIQSAGNLPDNGTPPYIGTRDHLIAGRDYPHYLTQPSCRVANPAQSLQALTVGSVAYGPFADSDWRSFAADPGHPSAFSRSGFGIWDVIKPEVVEYGGDCLRNGSAPPDVGTPVQGRSCYPELVRSTLYPPGPAADRDEVGTSFAAPKVARIAAQLQRILPDESSLLYRALIVQSATWPDWAARLIAQLTDPTLGLDQPTTDLLRQQALAALMQIGFGIPDEARATTNTDFRTTYISSGEQFIHAKECHIYQVPIPQELRRQADEFDIKVEVTLSYVAQPRRTRRNLRRYLSTWVDWKSSKLDEPLDVFRRRAIKDDDEGSGADEAQVFPWVLHENPKWGVIRGAKRNGGTVQKDWAIAKSNRLPDHFCLAVVGHNGWSHDPDSAASYSMAVSFEILGQEIPIYEPLLVAVRELQAEIEAETEAEIEVEEDDENEGDE
jgi:hypothetical protein